MHRSKAKTFFKYLTLVLAVAEMIVLLVESLMPGSASSQQSGAVGNAVDGLLTDIFGGDGIADVKPESISLKSDGKQVESLTLACGERAELYAAAEPANTSVNYLKTTWESSNANVATVRGGTVCAVGVGTATVTVRLASDSSLSASATVTVTEVYAERIELESDGFELKTGDAAVLDVKFFPKTTTYKKLSYTSENEAVATVDEQGVIHAAGVGETTVRVQYGLPERAGADPLTASATVRVSPAAEAPVLPTDLSVTLRGTLGDGNSPYLYVGGEASAEAELLPADADECGLVWESSDDAVLSVDRTSGVMTANRKGRATVRVFCAAAPDICRELPIEVRKDVLGAVIGTAGGKKLAETEEPNAYTLSVTAGEKIPITVSALPENYFVKYGTENSEIAEISDEGVLLPYRADKKGVLLSVTVSDSETFADGDGDLSETFTIRVTVGKQPFSFSVANWAKVIRKLFGHFGLFLLLGLLAGISSSLFEYPDLKRRLLVLLILLLAGFAFAGLTEILQLGIFTSGRGAAFADVLIDYSGFAPALIAVSAIDLLVRFVKRKKRKS